MPAFAGGRAVALLDSLQGGQFVEWSRVASGPALTRPGAPLDSFKIDWRALEQRRRFELDKLETMQLYAYTKRCRRAFVLRYFGDPAVRPECGACDNCTGPPAPSSKPTRRRPRRAGAP